MLIFFVPQCLDFNSDLMIEVDDSALVLNSASFLVPSQSGRVYVCFPKLHFEIILKLYRASVDL